jgi:GTP cyclohydrolase II
MNIPPQKNRGKNIKLFDKIKLEHNQTKTMLHTLNKQLKNPPKNMGIGCHKLKDQTDW